MGYSRWIGIAVSSCGDLVQGIVEVGEVGVELVFAVVEGAEGCVVAVYAGVEGVFEIGDGGAVDEVVEVLLFGSGGLETGFDGGVAEDGESGLDAGEGDV